MSAAPTDPLSGELYVVDMDITVAIHTDLRIAYHEHATVSLDTVHCIETAFLSFIQIGDTYGLAKAPTFMAP